MGSVPVRPGAVPAKSMMIRYQYDRVRAYPLVSVTFDAEITLRDVAVHIEGRRVRDYCSRCGCLDECRIRNTGKSITDKNNNSVSALQSAH